MCLLQSLVHVPSSLYTTLHFQEAVYFLQPILLLTPSKYCCVVLRTLFVLVLCNQTRAGALILHAPHITCICHLPIIHWSILCSCYANIDDVSCGQPQDSFNQPDSSSLYCLDIWLWSSFYVKLCYLFLLCPSYLVQFFPSFFPFSLTFFANNDTSFIKWYSCSYLSQCFFCFHFQWHLFFPAFISLCCPCPFVCYCIHVACHSSFCFLINLSETFQSSPTIFSFLLESNLSSLACLPWNPCLRNA